MGKTTDRSVEHRADIHRHLESLLRRQARRYRRRLKQCRRGFSEKAVHELRVSIRRLLATVGLLGEFMSPRRVKKVRRALKEQLDVFDELRDTQVGLSHVAALPRTGRAPRAFTVFLRDRQRNCVRQVRKRVRRMSAGRVVDAVNEFAKELKARRQAAKGPKDTAAVLRCLNDAHARTVALRSQIDPAAPVTLHRTRVAFKRFRYMVEALALLLPGVSAPQLRGLRAYQNRMGAIQDATVLLRTAQEFARNAAETEALLRFQAGLESRRQRLIAGYLQVADRLRAFWPPRDPARLVGSGRARARTRRPASNTATPLSSALPTDTTSRKPETDTP